MKGVDESLAAKAIDFIADDRVQRTRVAMSDDAKINFLFNCKILLKTGKRLSEIK